jgi:hypothetical protein
LYSRQVGLGLFEMGVGQSPLLLDYCDALPKTAILLIEVADLAEHPSHHIQVFLKHFVVGQRAVDDLEVGLRYRAPRFNRLFAHRVTYFISPERFAGRRRSPVIEPSPGLSAPYECTREWWM